MKLSSILLLLFFAPAESQNNDTGMNYGIDAFECDDEGNYLEEKQKKKLGTVYQLCMAPNQAAKDAGVGIEKLESWEWAYMTGDDEFTFQPVADGKQAVPGLSSFNCIDEGSLCRFNSFLTSDFYRDPGSVTGKGSVSLTGETGTIPVYLDLFLKKFKITLDPQLQQVVDNMKDAEAAKALGDIEGQAEKLYKEEAGDAGNKEETEDAGNKEETGDAGNGEETGDAGKEEL